MILSYPIGSETNESNSSPKVSPITDSVRSSHSLLDFLPSPNAAKKASNGFWTTSYGLKYEKLIAFPLPLTHLSIGNRIAFLFHGAANDLLYASSSSSVTPVSADEMLRAAVPAPPSTVYAPISLRYPICLNKGLVEDISFPAMFIILKLVLIISAGNDTKLPNGNFLIALITSGTLL